MAEYHQRKPKGLLDAIYNVGYGLSQDIPKAINWFGEQARKPQEEAMADVVAAPGAVAKAAYEYTGDLAKRNFESAEKLSRTGVYDPAPVLEAATLPMGTGAIAGVPLRAGETALGAGILRPTKELPLTGGYHGTIAKNNFKKFKQSDVDLGTHFADDPDVAVQYALGSTMGFEGLTEGARTIPVVADIKKSLKYPTDPTNWAEPEWVMEGLKRHINDYGFKAPKGLLDDMVAAEKSSGGWQKNFIPMLKDKKYDSIIYPHSTYPRSEPDFNSWLAFDPRQVTPRLSEEGQQLIKQRGIYEPSKKLNYLDDVEYWNELPESEKVWFKPPSKPKPSSAPSLQGTTLSGQSLPYIEQVQIHGLLDKLESGELDLKGYIKEHDKLFGLK